MMSNQSNTPIQLNGKYSSKTRKLVNNLISSLEPPEDLNVWQWAEKYRIMPAGYTDRPGPYDASFTSYWKKLMEVLTDRKYKAAAVMAAAQTAKSEVGVNFIGYLMACKPTTIYIVMPGDHLVKDYSSTKIQPMLDASPVFKKILYKHKPGKSGSSQRKKMFKGGWAIMVNGDVAANLRSRSAEVVILEEIDGFQKGSKEGSAPELAMKRNSTYKNGITYMNSTPVDADTSYIYHYYLLGNMDKYHLPCPHCGHYQELVFENLKIPKDENGNFITNEAMYLCNNEGCGGLWTTEDRNKLIREEKGVWIASNPNPVSQTIYTAHFSCLSSPLRSFQYIAEEWVKCKGDKEALKTFYNTILGLPWEDKDSKPDSEKLMNRAEDYEPNTFIVDEKIKVITCGVDVQQNRLAFSLWGWGLGQECWCLGWDEIYCADGKTTGDSEVWEKLDLIINNKYKWKDENGVIMDIEAVAIDCNYSASQQAVYDFCRQRTHRQVFPVRGANTTWGKHLKKPSYQDVDYNGQYIKAGVKMWNLSTASIKEHLYERMRITDFGPGYVHTYKSARPDLWQQLTAETLKNVRKPGGGIVKEWHCPTHIRNEALDTFVYAYSAMLSLGFELPGAFSNRESELKAADAQHRNLAEQSVLYQQRINDLAKPKQGTRPLDLVNIAGRVKDEPIKENTRPYDPFAQNSSPRDELDDLADGLSGGRGRWS